MISPQRVLYEACLAGDIENAKAALAAGADASAALDDDPYMRPLFPVCEDGHLELVVLLLEARADPNGGIDCTPQSATASDEQFDTHIDSPLLLAMENRHVLIAKKLLAAGASPTMIGQMGNTALQLACQCGDLDLVSTILGSNPDTDVNISNTFGSTPLHFACMSGSVAIVKLLLAKGARVDVEDDDGTPFDVAVQEGHVQLMQVLVGHGADIHKVDEDGENVLFHASRRANAECVVEALRLGANARHVDNQQQSPLHCIASAGHGVLARHEDDDGDEDDDIDDDGEDANISLQIAQALALAGENGRSQQVGKSRGLKHVDHHRDDEHDNDVHVGEADDIIDNHHDEQSDEDDGDLVKQSSAIVRALVHAGADINARNCGMRTPLHLAALRGNSTLAAALIHAGASTVLVDEDGRTPAELATGRHQEQLMALLSTGDGSAVTSE